MFPNITIARNVMYVNIETIMNSCKHSHFSVHKKAYF